MTEEVLYQRKAVLVRRMTLEPGEASRWQRDVCHRVTVVLSGDRLASEVVAGGRAHQVSVRAGLVDWDVPSPSVHRAVNVGRLRYEEVVTFFLAHRGQNPQPASVGRSRSHTTKSSC